MLWTSPVTPFLVWYFATSSVILGLLLALQIGGQLRFTRGVAWAVFFLWPVTLLFSAVRLVDRAVMRFNAHENTKEAKE